MNKSLSFTRVVAVFLPALLFSFSACTGSRGLGVDAGAQGGRSEAGSGGSAGGAETGGSGAGGKGGDGTGGAGGSGLGGVSGACGPTGCGADRLCCGGVCVNPANDPMNCGQCTRRCPVATSYCGGGTCQAAPCQRDGGSCAVGASCCGSACCGAGDICCDPQGPLSTLPVCHTPTTAQPTCPLGCAPLCKSDRNLKRDIVPIDPVDILAKVSALPISTWSYNDQPSNVRHLGPMAQDFHARFGLGDDDRTYNSIDAHGVALAAIQALDHLVKQQQRKIRILERRNERLSGRLRAIEIRDGAAR